MYACKKEIKSIQFIHRVVTQWYRYILNRPKKVQQSATRPIKPQLILKDKKTQRYGKSLLKEPQVRYSQLLVKWRR